MDSVQVINIMITLKEKRRVDDEVYSHGVPKIMNQHYDHVEQGPLIKEAIKQMDSMRQNIAQDLQSSQSKDKVVQDLQADKLLEKIKQVWKYFTQLDLFELHFTADYIGDHLKFAWQDLYDSNGQINPFGDDRGVVTQSSVAFEKASVLFIIAQKLSLLANVHLKEFCANVDQDGLKKSFNFYQAAAGCFAFIRDNFLHAPSFDLNKSVVDWLSKLHLAQAQEVFTMKAWLDLLKGVAFNEDQTVSSQDIELIGKKAILGKLAAGTGDQYTSLLNDFSSSLVEGDIKMEQYLPKDWSLIVQLKQLYFQALAQLHSSFKCEQESQIGQGVARMQQAVQITTEMMKVAAKIDSAFSKKSLNILPLQSINAIMGTSSSSITSQSGSGDQSKFSVVDQLKRFQSFIEKRFKRLNKDNDVVYHDVVPAISTLPPLASLAASKCTRVIETIPELADIVNNQVDLFKQLIPLNTLEQESVLSAKKDEFVRQFKQKALDANDQIAITLASLEVPDILSLLSSSKGGKSTSQNGAQLSEELLDELKKRSSDPNLRQALANNTVLSGLFDVRSQVATITQQCQQCINQDLAEDQSFRQNFGVKQINKGAGADFWKSYQDQLSKLQYDLSQGYQADEKLQQQYQQVELDMKLVLAGEQDILNAFQQSMNQQQQQHQSRFPDLEGLSLLDTPSELTVSPKVENSRLDELLQRLQKYVFQLDQLQKEREELIAQLQKNLTTGSPSSDVSNMLLINRTREEDVMQFEMRKLQAEFGQKLDGSIKFQLQIFDVLAESGNNTTTGGLIPQIKNLEQFKSQSKSTEETRKFCSHLVQSSKTFDQIMFNVTKGKEFYGKLLKSAESLLKNCTEASSRRAADRNRERNVSPETMTEILQRKLAGFQ
ncbi:hypothetical protein MP228_011561 [Amoeboaphelidium protococcarum]|nr:hypothetical protein MP228_011561 [Amoeboaphelidium protococcarum]